MDALQQIPYWEKYVMTIQEAANYFNVGEKRLRQIVAEQQGADFILEVGSHKLIKKKLFEKFIDSATVV